MTNYVLVTMDSVRADHTSLYGYSADTTPFLSSLEGTLFRTAYANAPYTPGSIPSLLTSKYPLESGHVAYSDTPTLPEFLDDSTYTTAAIYNNLQIERFGYNEQFDEAYSLTGVQSKTEGPRSGTGIGDTLEERMKHIVKKHEPVRAAVEDTYYRFTSLDQPHPTDDIVTDTAIEWIQEHTEPFLLWVHYMDTHHPYHFEPEDFDAVSDESYDPHRYARLQSRACHHIRSGEFVWSLSDAEREYVRDAYDASIRHLDRQLERLFSALDTDRTTVFVTSDHGEELWERGHFGHAARPTKPRDLTLYDEMIRVPLFVVGPEMSETEVQHPVSLVDLVPTILSAADVTVPDTLRGTPVQEFLDGDKGGSETPVISQATSPGDPKAYAESSDSNAHTAVRLGRYKYIFRENRKDELYDIDSDPEEHQNCIDEYPEIASELRETAQLWTDSREALNAETKDSRKVQEQLENLGYR